VAGVLSEALGRVTRTEPPALTCAGRTDAGVHARGQVVHAELPEPLPGPHRRGAEDQMSPEELCRTLNRQLAPAVVVRRAGRAPEGFDARRSATSRTYRYLLFQSAVPDPLLHPVSWLVPANLDRRAMAQAADAVVGSHDFRAFCRRPPGTGPDQALVRRVRRAGFEDLAVPASTGGAGPQAAPRLVSFSIVADSFCHQMVRALVAQLVEVGQGRETVAGLVERLRSGERSGAPRPAPPWGLCLTEVSYTDGWPGEPTRLPSGPASP
jgi:tRNA pseudouridine38-40 synthase